MDISPRGFLRNWVPHLPSLIQLSILAALRKSPNANHQDWVVEIFVAAVRPILQTPAPLLKSQRTFMYGPPIWPSTWIVNCRVPPPDYDIDPPTELCKDAVTINQAMSFVIDALRTGVQDSTCSIPPFESAGVEAEWVSHRKDWSWWTTFSKTSKQAYEAAISELEDGEDSPVILFAHGGAFCLMDPANHRPMTSALAQNTNSRVLAVRYRLSPQHIFPSALMDMFLWYLALLSPPPGALHKAVAADRIVVAGDSSGGNLASALQVLLSTLVQHGKTTIISPWQDHNAPSQKQALSTIEIPSKPSAALSVLSPWLDLTRSLPSQHQNSRWDFVAPPSALSPDLISTSPLFPADSIWPSDPPRTETYCEARMCAHPLVNPIMATSDILRFFPSTYICVGWEGMTDESEVFARKIWDAKFNDTTGMRRFSEKHDTDSGYVSSAESTALPLDAPPGVDTVPSVEDSSIIFDGYIAMPHTFPMISFHPASLQANSRRYDHINRAVSSIRAPRSAAWNSTTSSATWTHTASRPIRSTSLSLSTLGMSTDAVASSTSGYHRSQSLTNAYVRESILHGRDFRVQLEDRLQREAITRKTAREGDAGLPKDSRMTSIATRLTFLLWLIIFRIRDFVFLIMNWALWQTMQFRTQI